MNLPRWPLQFLASINSLCNRSRLTEISPLLFFDPPVRHFFPLNAKPLRLRARILNRRLSRATIPHTTFAVLYERHSSKATLYAAARIN